MSSLVHRFQNYARIFSRKSFAVPLRTHLAETEVLCEKQKIAQYKMTIPEELCTPFVASQDKSRPKAFLSCGTALALFDEYSSSAFMAHDRSGVSVVLHGSLHRIVGTF